LSWTASSGAISYDIKRNTAANNLVTIAAGVTGTGYTDTTAANGTQYFYAVSANGPCGSPSVDSNVVSATPNNVSLPPAPTNLQATSGPGAKKITLTWNASGGATSYNVYRSTITGGPYTQIATAITTTTFANTGLASGAPYYYVVKAVNGAGESGPSNQASATTR